MEALAIELTTQLETAFNQFKVEEVAALLNKLKEIGVDLNFDFYDTPDVNYQEPQPQQLEVVAPLPKPEYQGHMRWSEGAAQPLKMLQIDQDQREISQPIESSSVLIRQSYSLNYQASPRSNPAGLSRSSADRGQFSPEYTKILKGQLISRGYSASEAFRISKNVTTWGEYDNLLESYQA